jgi:hypothetical protein
MRHRTRAALWPIVRYSGAGVSSLDDDGMQSISQGETIVSDVLPIGPIENDGTSPLAASWETDTRNRDRRIPRACRE